MATETLQIVPGSRVTLHFSLTLADGSEAVATFGEAPFSFTLGDGSMVELLEQSLIGLCPGDELETLLAGDEVFGPATEENIQRLPRSDFPADMALAPGQVIAFTTPGGEETAGTLLELDADEARIDFNHPLSGHSLLFKVQILEVGPAKTSD